MVADQALVEQNDRRARTRLAEATANVAQLQARLDELVRGPRAELVTAARANLEGATQDLEFREHEMDRTREVHARGLASPDALDRSQAALDAAVSTLDQRNASRNWRSSTGTTVEELARAEQAVKQAQARRDAARIDLERHLIRSRSTVSPTRRLFETRRAAEPGQPS